MYCQNLDKFLRKMAAEFNVASVVKYLLVIETKRILC